MLQPALLDHFSLPNWLLVQISNVTFGLLVRLLLSTSSFSCLFVCSVVPTSLHVFFLPNHPVPVLQTTLTMALILMLPPRSKETCVQV